MKFLFLEIASYYVNKNQVLHWMELSKKNKAIIDKRIKIKAKLVTPQLTNFQTKSLLELNSILNKQNYEKAILMINELDTASREVFFSVLKEFDEK